MPIHFAAAENRSQPRLSRAQAKAAIMSPANDNASTAELQHNQKVLKAALRHFAANGMGAAQDAQARAERAFFKGDREGYQWWLAVCRTLDRRLAEALSSKANRKTKGD